MKIFSAEPAFSGNNTFGGRNRMQHKTSKRIERKQSSMYCSNCGNPLPESSCFCNKCGAKVSSGYANLQNANPNHYLKDTAFHNSSEHISALAKKVKRAQPAGTAMSLFAVFFNLLAAPLSPFLFFISGPMLIAGIVVSIYALQKTSELKRLYKIYLLKNILSSNSEK